MAITRRRLAVTTAGLLAAPAVLAPRSAAAQPGETIKIGVVSPGTGPAAESGKLQLNGARQALEAVNERGVLGRKMELVVEDDQTTNPGAVLAFSRLAGRGELGCQRPGSA